MSRFRPAKRELVPDKIVISVRLKQEKLEELDKIATNIDISRNELINQCIDYALDNIDFNNKKIK